MQPAIHTFIQHAALLKCQVRFRSQPGGRKVPAGVKGSRVMEGRAVVILRSDGSHGDSLGVPSKHGWSGARCRPEEPLCLDAPGRGGKSLGRHVLDGVGRDPRAGHRAAAAWLRRGALPPARSMKHEACPLDRWHAVNASFSLAAPAERMSAGAVLERRVPGAWMHGSRSAGQSRDLPSFLFISRHAREIFNAVSGFAPHEVFATRRACIRLKLRHCHVGSSAKCT